jgi:hypothetical protein
MPDRGGKSFERSHTSHRQSFKGSSFKRSNTLSHGPSHGLGGGGFSSHKTMSGFNAKSMNAGSHSKHSADKLKRQLAYYKGE